MIFNVNFLPWRDNERRQQAQNRLAVSILVWFLCAIAIGVVYVYFLLEETRLEVRKNYLEYEINLLSKPLSEISEIEATKKFILSRIKLIDKMQGERPKVVKVLEHLIIGFPENTYLTNISFRHLNNNSELYFDSINEAQMTLVGLSRSNAQISDLMNALDSSSLFGTPVLQSVSIDQNSSTNNALSNFTMSADVKFNHLESYTVE